MQITPVPTPHHLSTLAEQHAGMDDMAAYSESLQRSPLALTTHELTAESDGLAMRVLRRETTARDVSLVQALAARLRTMVMRPATNREALEGMLLIDIPDESEARAPVLRFDGVERRTS